MLTIFAKNATYHERLYEKPHQGHEGIKAYWKNKVVKDQSNIKFKLKNVYVDGNTAVAEWEAKFHEKRKKCTTHIKEIAVLEIEKGKIKALREYWHSKHTR